MEKLSDVCVTSSLYSGAVIEAKLDGESAGIIAYAPFKLKLEDVASGHHTLSLTLYATRVNTFGSLHSCVDFAWKGPNVYFTRGCEWSYEYNLGDVGILKSPIIEIFDK